MDRIAAKTRLAAIVRSLATDKRSVLESLKGEHVHIGRIDFIWHYLLQSFATMGRASGSRGLIDNKENYQRVTYPVLASLTPMARVAEVREVCRIAGIRMPDRKASFILGCFDCIARLGGLEAAKAKLMALSGRDAKIAFLQTFPGIGPKYARNIMMDVYYEDFRDSIALDVRIKAITLTLGLSFSSYTEHEAFYLDVAHEAGLNGWELDRILFSFRPEVESRLRFSETATSEFVICISNESNPASLIVGKIYRRLPDTEAETHQMLQIVDEDTSEADGYLYLASMFVPVEIPEVAKKVLMATGN